jgi:cardiolipin synthase
MPGLWQRSVELWPYLGIFAEALGFALIPAVLARRKEPPSTLAWILALLFLPGFGAALFLVHGRDRMRWPAKRKRAADRVVEARLGGARSRAQAAGALTTVSSEGQGIFRVCQSLGGAIELTSGNHVEVYDDGSVASLAMERAIDAAQSSVLAEYYLVRNDATGARFRDQLVRAAKRGVEVRLLLDAYGCFWLPGRWFRPLKAAGVKVAEFLPLSQALRLPMNLRTHRKILVVDGETAFTGGLNIGDEYVGAKGDEAMWRDTHMCVTGPAVGSLAAVFLRDWHFMTGQSDVDPRFFPEATHAGDVRVAVVPSGPDDPRESIHRLFFAAIVGARRRVWITTPYFVPDRSLLVALEGAALRGVSVRMILPSRSNHGVTHRAGTSFYAELLEAGVELYAYLPGMIHSKTMLVDDELTLIGSANMDMRSFRLNFEVHTLMHDRTLTQTLEARFEADRANCRQLLLEEWMRRPWHHRVREGAARLVSPIL